VLTGYLNGGSTFPKPLSREEEARYLNEMRAGSKEARDRLIEHNLRLVAHIVKKFDGSGEDPEDLISVGTIGLIKGIESFDPAKGTRLATYVARCIENDVSATSAAFPKHGRVASVDPGPGRGGSPGELCWRTWRTMVEGQRRLVGGRCGKATWFRRRRVMALGLRTAEEYLASLRDGRRVYFRGRAVPDVTTEPAFRAVVDNFATVFRLQHDPAHRELATVALPSGERISRYYQVPRSREDLFRRMELIDTTSRLSFGLDTSYIKLIGANVLNGLTTVAARVDRETGSRYLERVEAFREKVAREDLAMVLAETDPKGDRSKPPSEQDPDLYLHMVERRPDGIVVRGAKVSVSGAPLANEVIVIPSRAVRESDADYAVAFAVPANAPGLRIIAHSAHTDPGGLDPFDYPISARFQSIDATVVFDDVFVPWERVFLAGEWQYTRDLIVAYSTHARFGNLAAKPALADLFVGAAQLIAEYNGLDQVPAIRDKITDLIIYAETLRSLAYAAASACEVVDGVAIPNLVMTNMAKYYQSSEYHRIIHILADIAGGGVITSAGGADLTSSEVGAFVEKYFQGRAGVPTAHRLRAFKLIRDLVGNDLGGYLFVVNVHAQGSPAAQRLTIYRETDLRRYRDYAMRAAGIEPAGEGCAPPPAPGMV
ncbi:MAG: hypothetical protein IRY95_05500, partial [Clostridia bacterium]|nr:hypothetical protein [Clostridia bacterium]